jgi:selenocysteine-specific elongation factor
MKHIIIGTAGHIDHGKTSLVRALTGTDTDRLKEEKERGITIELGFAQLDIGELRAGIVDVPGHERFVKNMLAGAGGIDLVILVIAADEGVMPQTREHLAICRLLGVKAGLIALTKCDLVEPDWVELVTDDLADFVKDTFLEGQPVVPVSSVTGAGLDALQDEIARLAEDTIPKSGQGIFRLPIDRVFSMKGFGAVVTGTLFSGAIRVGERVQIFPGDAEARVRGLQVHGEAVEEAVAGTRTAVNLQGVERIDIERGGVLGRASELKATYMLDVRLEHIHDAPRPLKTRDRVRFHTGTSEVMGRVSVIGADAIESGESAFAQIRLEAPVSVLPRDRFVIRSYSPVVTIGGGEILDVAPKKHRRLRISSMEHFDAHLDADETTRLELLLADEGSAGADIAALTGRLTLNASEIRSELTALAKAGRARIVETESGLSLSEAHFTALQKAITEFLAAYHKTNPLKPGAPREEVRGKGGGAGERAFAAALKVLVDAGTLIEEGSQIRLATHKVKVGADLAKVKTKLDDFFKLASFQPPMLKEVFNEAGTPEGPSKEAMQVLVDEGALIRLKEDLIYHKDALAGARSRLENYLGDHDNISASEFRDLLGITRKHAIPLLEYFDTARITLRIGDKRVLRSRPDEN